MQNTSQRTLLLIEASSDIRTLIKVSLAPIPDLQIHTALSKAEGIQLAQSMRPDIILLDLDTAEFHNFQTLLKDKQVSFILLSSRVRLTEKLESAELGTHVLQKPFDPEVLHQVIENIIDSINGE